MLFSSMVKGWDFHIHVLWTQLDYSGRKELEESEIIQVVSQAEHVCLNALDAHPVVSLFYLLFKIHQLWRIFLYILILSMGYLSSFSYSWWISYQFTLRSHCICLVEKPTFNVNVTVIYMHSDVSSCLSWQCKIHFFSPLPFLFNQEFYSTPGLGVSFLPALHSCKNQLMADAFTGCAEGSNLVLFETTEKISKQRN